MNNRGGGMNSNNRSRGNYSNQGNRGGFNNNVRGGFNGPSQNVSEHYVFEFI